MAYLHICHCENKSAILKTSYVLIFLILFCFKQNWSAKASQIPTMLAPQPQCADFLDFKTGFNKLFL